MENRSTITVRLWPRGFMFEGKRVDPAGCFKPSTPTIIAAAPGDLELLIAEYKRTPNLFEQEAARSLEAALQEWREKVAAEDENAIPASYPDHEEHRTSKLGKEQEPYG